MQSKSLGCSVYAFDDDGNSVVGKVGELVCTKPLPSMPLYFWGDKQNKRLTESYFETFPGVWKHGDWIEFTDYGGSVIYGRSDATLNPGGARLGTAEIYSIVDKFNEVKESIVIGQQWDNDVRIILFIVLKTPKTLTEKLTLKLKKAIRQNASPRHVPKKIIEVSDIPRTKNGKIVELLSLIHI